MRKKGAKGKRADDESLLLKHVGSSTYFRAQIKSAAKARSSCSIEENWTKKEAIKSRCNYTAKQGLNCQDIRRKKLFEKHLEMGFLFHVLCVDCP